MANPTKGWDKVPIFGWYMELDGVTPKAGTVNLTLSQRVTSTNGRTIFPGGTIKAILGADENTAVKNLVKNAMRTADQAAVEAGGGTFDGAAWDADWDARLPGAFFTSFPASDDPDIVESGFQVKIEEKLNSGDGKVYYLTPLLSMLDAPIPGLNVGTIAVPPGSPTAPAPIYAKGQPGGVASLDSTGVVPLAQIPSGITASAVWGSIQDQPAVIAAGATEQEALDAIGAASAADVVPDTRTVAGKPLSADVTLSAADVGAGTYSKPQFGIPRSDFDASTQTALGKADTALDATQKGAANGVATLDGSLKIPSAQMPDIAIVNYLGAVGSQAAMLALTGQRGDWTIRTDLGTTWTITGDDPAQLGNWVQLSYPTAPVTSVASKTGAVTLAKADVGLGSVDNTSDANKPISTAAATAFASRLNWRGDYVDGGTYAVNDVVNSPGYGSYKCLQAHTSSGSAPNIESPFWHLLGSAVVIGTNTGQAADGGATSAALGAKLDSGYAGAVPGTVFTVLWVAGTGWPARPTTRTDVFVDWVDVTGESTDTDTPTDIVTGDRIVQIVTGTGGTSAITVRSVTSAAGTAAADYQNSPLPLTGPAGIAIGDYYLVAACFGSLPPGSDFIAPAGFTRLTPAIATGQDFAVFGRPIGTSADVSAVASTNWSPNTHTSTRAVVVGVALQGVASVGTATAVTFANPIASPYTLDAATGDATFQVVYTGNGSTSTHPVHASVGGTLLVQATARTAATDPTSDNVLSISMNGTGVSWSPAAAYGGATNIPMTKA